MKKVLIPIGIVVLIVLVTTIWFNLPKTIQNSCGSEFNNIYKEHAEKGLSPEFCLDIDKIKIKYRENLYGFSGCYGFNGHKYDDGFQGVIYSDNIDYKIISGFYRTVYHDYEGQRQPIAKGACVESFSVHTKTNHCDVLLGVESTFGKKVWSISERDWCIIKLAERLNDASICEETTEPDYNPSEEYCKTHSCTVKHQRGYFTARYHCYVNLKIRGNEDVVCDNIPGNISNSVDKLRDRCFLLDEVKS
jgi:hypothetical protein